MLGKVQQLILLITIILMIGFIIMLVWVFRQAKKKNWPPSAQPCPDYWTMLTNGKCKYGGNNGACPNTTELDFSPLSDCEKKDWATNYSDGKLYTGNDGSVTGEEFCQGPTDNVANGSVNKNMHCIYGYDSNDNYTSNCNTKMAGSFFCTSSNVGSILKAPCGTVRWDGITYGNDPCN